MGGPPQPASGAAGKSPERHGVLQRPLDVLLRPESPGVFGRYAGQYLLDRFMNFQPPTPRAKAPTPKKVMKSTRRRLWPVGSFLITATVSPWGISVGVSATGAVVAVGNCGLGGSTASSGGTAVASGGAASLALSSFSLSL